MMKGKKRWLIALLAALAGAIPVLVPGAGPLVEVIAKQSVRDGGLPPLDPLDPRQCASNLSACPPVP